MQSTREEKSMKVYRVADPNPSYFFGGIVDWFKSLPNKSFGGITSKLIVPAQFREPQFLGNLSKLEERYHVTMNPYTVIAHDGAQLDSIEVTPVDIKPYQFVVIKFNGNNMLYEDRIRELANDAHELKATVVGFNYRGVNQSKGVIKSENNVLTDGIAQVQRLLDQKIPAEHILLDGISLGGAIATLVAYHFYQKGINLFLFNDRSFSTVAKTATGIIFKNSSECTQTSAELTSFSLLTASQWNMNAGEAFRLLPRKNTAHMFVDKRSTEYPDNRGDEVISYDASLHAAVSDVEKGYKMLVNRNIFTSGHNAPRTGLLLADTKEEKTGQDVFREFANQKRSGK